MGILIHLHNDKLAPGVGGVDMMMNTNVYCLFKSFCGVCFSFNPWLEFETRELWQQVLQKSMDFYT